MRSVVDCYDTYFHETSHSIERMLASGRESVVVSLTLEARRALKSILKQGAGKTRDTG